MIQIAAHVGNLYHPHAVQQAKDMERHGYVQVPHGELKDGEDVMLLHGGDGSTAPARYYRHGKVADGDGKRDEHVFELYPDSQYADSLGYHETLLPQESQEGEQVSRMGIFRLTQPEHAEHGRAMYAARDTLHRAGSNR